MLWIMVVSFSEETGWQANTEMDMGVTNLRTLAYNHFINAQPQWLAERMTWTFKPARVQGRIQPTEWIVQVHYDLHDIVSLTDQQFRQVILMLHQANDRGFLFHEEALGSLIGTLLEERNELPD